jgi:hypothetical protein
MQAQPDRRRWRLPSETTTELEENTMTTASRTTRLLAAAGAGGVALSCLFAAPASAASTSFVDGPDASGSRNDILRVSVNHGAERARVVVTFADLRKRSEGGPASIVIFLDTKRSRKGPEFRLDSGLQNGTDYQLSRAKNWKPVGEPRTCDHHVDLKFHKDRLVFMTARDCIGTPDALRVGAKMTDLFDASHPIHDWMKGPRRWTDTVASG